tara:strand:- start:171554 stop:172396 length:843 start_codon:yes stop_codon:yes gene_type:complete
MAEIGKYNILTVLRETGSGFYLDGEDLGDILLPGKLAPQGTIEDDDLEVFLYNDSEDRLIATTERPHAVVGQFAALTVVDVHEQIGAFLDWGLGKDLLLPYREQGEVLVEVGECVVVYVKLDTLTQRIVATTKWQRFLSEGRPHYTDSQPVKFLITHRTPLGYNAIVEERYSGLVYHSDLGTSLKAGEVINGYVRTVRPDGKIDLSLDPSGPPPIRGLSESILAALKEQDGDLPYDDSSSPELIRKAFNVSKKVFKRTLSTLYKERKIEFPKEGGIRLSK